VFLVEFVGEFRMYATRLSLSISHTPGADPDIGSRCRADFEFTDEMKCQSFAAASMASNASAAGASSRCTKFPSALPVPRALLLLWTA
jgi:hypothetical protein